MEKLAVAKQCRDCGTTTHIIQRAAGAQYVCTNKDVCNRNLAAKAPADCADCGNNQISGAWHKDKFGRKVCNDLSKCREQRALAHSRGISATDYTPLSEIPTDASDLY